MYHLLLVAGIIDFILVIIVLIKTSFILTYQSEPSSAKSGNK
jgi:hypothetical protein